MDTLPVLYTRHNAGFFSCCTIRLLNIIDYFNKHNVSPPVVDSSAQFSWYKPHGSRNDITHDYFKQADPSQVIHLIWDNNDKRELQFVLYNTLKFGNIQPFIQKYFSLSDEILQIVDHMEKKYKIDYENTCALFYRGNDKVTETDIGGYSGYYDEYRRISALHPGVRFLIQSDETQFLQEMSALCGDTGVIFRDEIRHIPKQINTVDRVFANKNYEFSKYYLAITYIMSKCRYVVCGSGNCSMWIMFYRNNVDNVTQYNNGKWYHF